MLDDVINEQVKKHQVTIIIINNITDKSLIEKIDAKVKVVLLGRKVKSRNIFPILKLNCNLLKIRPDVIHCHNHFIIKMITLKSKAVFTAHVMHIPTLNLKYYKRVIAMSNAVKEDIEQRSNIKPVLIYNGVRTQDIVCKYNYSFNIFRILQIGRLEHMIKGQNILLEALQIMVYDKNIKNIHVDFLGAGQSLEYLQNLESDYQLEDHITFLGSKDRAYIYEHLKDYNLLVQPSLYEGFGLTIVEAMAAKVPVLVSDIDGPAEIVDRGHYGYLFKSKDATDLAKNIMHLMRIQGSDEFMKKINAAHIRAFKLFNISEMIKALENIYFEI